MSQNKQISLFNFNRHVPRRQIDGTFSQYDLKSDQNQTIGLGLYVSKQIILSNKGKMDFVSKPEKGSIFIFTMKMEISDAENISELDLQVENGQFEEFK